MGVGGAVAPRPPRETGGGGYEEQDGGSWRFYCDGEESSEKQGAAENKIFRVLLR